MNCPKCEGALQVQDKNTIVCSSCDFKDFNNPRPTNGVLFENKKGEILLVKRKNDPKKGYWDIPGGFLNVEETVEESVAREIHEELGIKIAPFTYLTSKYDRYLYEGRNEYTIMFVFVAPAPEGKINATDDITEARFFSKEEIPYDKIAFNGVKEALKEYVTK